MKISGLGPSWGLLVLSAARNSRAGESAGGTLSFAEESFRWGRLRPAGESILTISH